MFSSPFIEERLYLEDYDALMIELEEFSSPFIEERLYFIVRYARLHNRINSSRPLLSRSGCILTNSKMETIEQLFSSPFIEERLYL